MKKKIVFIVGHGHSGSSIIGRLLSSKRYAVHIGELGQIEKYYNKSDKCICGEHIDRCSFWGKSIQNVNLGLIKINTRHLFNIGQLKRRIDENIRIFQNIFDNRLDVDTVIDSSKNPVRALMITLVARKKWTVEIYETKRKMSHIKQSYRKRADKYDAGRLAKRPGLFFINYVYYRFLTVVTGTIFKALGVKKFKIHQGDYRSFIENTPQLNVEPVSETEYKINEYLNHSLGGSYTSWHTHFKV